MTILKTKINENVFLINTEKINDWTLISGPYHDFLDTLFRSRVKEKAPRERTIIMRDENVLFEKISRDIDFADHHSKIIVWGRVPVDYNGEELCGYRFKLWGGEVDYYYLANLKIASSLQVT